MKEDKPVHVGWISNVPDEMKRDIVAAPDKYKYKVYELSCMEVEHIDGNYKNNNEDNLILLCPNCHSLTSTYKGANLNHGRKIRSKYYNNKKEAI